MHRICGAVQNQLRTVVSFDCQPPVRLFGELCPLVSSKLYYQSGSLISEGTDPGLSGTATSLLGFTTGLRLHSMLEASMLRFGIDAFLLYSRLTHKLGLRFCSPFIFLRFTSIRSNLFRNKELSALEATTTQNKSTLE